MKHNLECIETIVESRRAIQPTLSCVDQTPMALAVCHQSQSNDPKLRQFVEQANKKYANNKGQDDEKWFKRENKTLIVKLQLLLFECHLQAIVSGRLWSHQPTWSPLPKCLLWTPKWRESLRPIRSDDPIEPQLPTQFGPIWLSCYFRKMKLVR